MAATIRAILVDSASTAMRNLPKAVPTRMAARVWNSLSPASFGMWETARPTAIAAISPIAEAILAHGGEARAARDAFAARPVGDQAAVVNFLKTLVVLPAGSTRLASTPR